MDFYCGECDMVIREEDVDTFYQPSEAWGHIVYEKFPICPKCGEPVGEFMGEPYTSEYNNPFGRKDSDYD